MGKVYEGYKSNVSELGAILRLTAAICDLFIIFKTESAHSLPCQVHRCQGTPTWGEPAQRSLCLPTTTAAPAYQRQKPHHL